MNNKMKQITDLTIALLCATRDEVATMTREIERHGVQAQCDAAIEKFAALTQALIKIRRCGNDFVAERAALESVIEGIAEAEIMVQTVKLIFGAAAVNKIRVKTMRRMEAEVRRAGE